MLELCQISKSIENFHLKNVSLYLPAGYIMGLAGENGAGKSTLQKIILGLYKPENGYINFCGKNMQLHEKEMKNEIGFVLSEDLFASSVSLMENANMYGKYYENYEKEIFTSYANQFGLTTKQKYKCLSKGEKLKFQFAFALSHQPRLLILDEPTANFDLEFKEKFMQILTAFVADGTKSVLLATHNMDELDQIADYLLVLHKGQVVLLDELEKIKDRYRFVSGDDIVINFIRKDRMIYKEKGTYFSRALVKHEYGAFYDRDLTVEIPSLEDFMYFYLKGEPKTC